MPNNSLDSTSVNEELGIHSLSHEYETFFEEQSAKLLEILERYTTNPIPIADDATSEVQEARREVQKNPKRILQSMYASAATLIRLQAPYDQALKVLAEANGVQIEGKNLDQVARLVESASIQRERSRIADHLNKGGKIAVIVLGIGGTGKGTMIEKSRFPRAVNHTNRARRPGEIEGKDYFYRDDFTSEQSREEVESVLKTQILADLIRPGRGRYVTTKDSLNNSLENSAVVFIEQAPEKVIEIAERAKEVMPHVLVIPVCVLPPGRGVLELVTRVIVRSYGDPTHRDPNTPEDVYKVKDSYLESTIGAPQIAEIVDTTQFLKTPGATGIVYIVNDDLSRAVNTLDNLFSL